MSEILKKLQESQAREEVEMEKFKNTRLRCAYITSDPRKTFRDAIFPDHPSHQDLEKVARCRVPAFRLSEEINAFFHEHPNIDILFTYFDTSIDYDNYIYPSVHLIYRELIGEPDD